MAGLLVNKIMRDKTEKYERKGHTMIGFLVMTTFITSLVLFNGPSFSLTSQIAYGSSHGGGGGGGGGAFLPGEGGQLGYSLNQVVYRGFDNSDEASPGSPLANQNNAFELPAQNDPFRIGVLVYVNEKKILESNKATLKLQVAERVGTCDTGFEGELYRNVTSNPDTPSSIATPIRFYDDAPGDKTIITRNGDLTYGSYPMVYQIYSESNNFSNPFDVPINHVALWNFSLVNDSASEDNAYCFRLTYADQYDIRLDKYRTIVETYGSNTQPSVFEGEGVIEEVADSDEDPILALLRRIATTPTETIRENGLASLSIYVKNVAYGILTLQKEDRLTLHKPLALSALKQVLKSLIQEAIELIILRIKELQLISSEPMQLDLVENDLREGNLANISESFGDSIPEMSGLMDRIKNLRWIFKAFLSD